MSESLETIRRECIQSQVRAEEARAQAAHKLWISTIIRFTATVVLFLAVAFVLAVRYLF